MASRCGPTRGASQISVISALAMRPPARTHDGGCVFHEDMRRDTLPLRIGRRKMRADVAGAAGGQKRVGQRMQADIGIGMAVELLRVRNGDAAKRHPVARLEGMHVVAVTGADIRKCRQPAGKPLVGHRDIPCPGQFDIVGRAENDLHRKAGPFGDRRVVGEIVAPGSVGVHRARKGSGQTENPAASARHGGQRGEPFRGSVASAAARFSVSDTGRAGRAP